MMRLAPFLAMLCAGCYSVVYEPSYCSRPGADTVGVIVNALGDTTNVIYEQFCAEWTAFGDSTKRWNRDGERLP